MMVKVEGDSTAVLILDWASVVGSKYWATTMELF